MTQFAPYHEAIVNLVNAVNHDREDLKRLYAYAILAKQTTVPREHRKSVAEAFAQHATMLRLGNLSDVPWAIHACDAVVAAMTAQDLADSTKEEPK